MWLLDCEPSHFERRQLTFKTTMLFRALQDVVNTAVVMEETALWSKLKRRFPNADLPKFHEEVEKNAEFKTLIHVGYEKNGLEQQVFSDDGQVRPGLYYIRNMRRLSSRIATKLKRPGG